MKKHLLYFVLLIGSLLSFIGCVRETPLNTNHKENFDALWNIINERYCYLDEKKVDWNNVYSYYLDLLPTVKGDEMLFFELLNKMLQELKDGHVNLYSTFDVGRYDEWMGDPTEGHNHYIRRKRFGERPRISRGMIYGIEEVKTDNGSIKIGLIQYSSFSSSLGNMSFIFNYMRDCKGIVLDVRGNGGGLIDNANKLVSYFIDETVLVGYHSYKVGPGPKDFSKLKPEHIRPAEGYRWTQRPVVVLQDRGSYSATNDFLSKIRVAPNVIRIGLPSGGGGGMPAMSELPNGWRVRYSAVRGYDRDSISIEPGINPDIYEANEKFDDNPSAPDRIMNRALKVILDVYGKTNSQ